MRQSELPEAIFLKGGTGWLAKATAAAKELSPWSQLLQTGNWPGMPTQYKQQSSHSPIPQSHRTIIRCRRDSEQQKQRQKKKQKAKKSVSSRPQKRDQTLASGRHDYVPKTKGLTRCGSPRTPSAQCPRGHRAVAPHRWCWVTRTITYPSVSSHWQHWRNSDPLQERPHDLLLLFLLLPFPLRLWTPLGGLLPFHPPLLLCLFLFLV